jgi:hypothetical protein
MRQPRLIPLAGSARGHHHTSAPRTMGAIVRASANLPAALENRGLWIERVWATRETVFGSRNAVIGGQLVDGVHDRSCGHGRHAAIGPTQPETSAGYHEQVAGPGGRAGVRPSSVRCRPRRWHSPGSLGGGLDCVVVVASTFGRRWERAYGFRRIGGGPRRDDYGGRRQGCSTLASAKRLVVALGRKVVRTAVRSGRWRTGHRPSLTGAEAVAIVVAKGAS